MNLCEKSFHFIVSGIPNACAFSGYVCSFPKYAYTWFECACTYACMHTHTKGFLQPFFFKHKFILPKISLLFP